MEYYMRWMKKYKDKLQYSLSGSYFRKMSKLEIEEDSDDVEEGNKLKIEKNSDDEEGERRPSSLT
jgi:hypothetical protein